MSTILALDASEWQGDLTRQHFEYAYALGVRLYICQLWGSGPTGLGPNDFAVRQLEDAVAVGMFIAGYTWLPPAGTTDTRFLYEASLGAAGNFASRLSFIAPDLEGARLHPTEPPTRLRDFINRVRGGGHPVVVYNRKSNWDAVMGIGVVQFGPDPLWEARYYFPSGSRPATAPDIDWNWTSYGGWQQRAILQYAGTAPVNGWSADWNVVDLDRLGFALRPTTTPALPLPPKPTPAPKEETTLSSAEFRTLNKKIDELAILFRDHARAPHPPASVRQPRPFRGTTYTVVAGDVLSLIAQRLLGNAGRFREIASLNGLTNPNAIFPGQVLKIPPK